MTTCVAVKPVAVGESPASVRRRSGSAVVFSALYFISSPIELAQGGFSTAQLALTYAAESAIPLFVVGLYGMQRPWIGRLGLIGVVAYAYSFIFFTSTVVLALVDGAKDWDALQRPAGWWVTIHGARGR